MRFLKNRVQCLRPDISPRNRLVPFDSLSSPPLAAGKSAKTGSVFKTKYRFVQFLLSRTLPPSLSSFIP